MYNAVALVGITVVLAVAFGLSYDRRKINWRTCLAALGLELAIAAFFFLAPGRRRAFDFLNSVMLQVLDCAGEGIAFLFGHLAKPPPGEFVLIIQALPMIVFFGALLSLLYHLGVMQKIIGALARAFSRLLRLSGAEALVTAGNIFVGIESALTVRPYIERMTRSELFLLLTAGMTTIASSVLAVYTFALKDVFPQIAVHLVSATVLSAPAAVCIAKIMCPETEEPLTLGKVVTPEYTRAASVVESILNGANEGIRMVIGICAAISARGVIRALRIRACRVPRHIRRRHGSSRADQTAGHGTHRDPLPDRREPRLPPDRRNRQPLLQHFTADPRNRITRHPTPSSHHPTRDTKCSGSSVQRSEVGRSTPDTRHSHTHILTHTRLADRASSGLPKLGHDLLQAVEESRIRVAEENIQLAAQHPRPAHGLRLRDAVEYANSCSDRYLAKPDLLEQLRILAFDAHSHLNMPRADSHNRGGYIACPD